LPRLGLGLVERGAKPHGHERVLQARAARVVHVHVARRDRRHAEPFRERRQRAVARTVAAPERPLELDPETLGAEGGKQALSETLGLVEDPRLDPACEQPVARAAREAYQALGVALELVERDARRERLAGVRTRAVVRERHEPAQVAIAGAVLHEQGEVRAVGEGQLGARDRLDPEALCGLGELHRAPEAVVVGERERGMAVHGGARDQLLGRGGAVQERVGRVRMQLDVHPVRRRAE
jgi:hypothetical protein